MVEAVLRHRSANVIFAHNHPSGTLRASSGDIQLTRLLERALTAIGIRVVDHVIVAGNHILSMADDGLLGER